MFKISLTSQTFFKSLSLLDICVFEQNVIFLLIDFNMHIWTRHYFQKQREEERKRRQEAENKPPAVSEMLNILGTMRRRAKPIRQSFKFTDMASQ